MLEPLDPKLFVEAFEHGSWAVENPETSTLSEDARKVLLSILDFAGDTPPSYSPIFIAVAADYFKTETALWSYLGRFEALYDVFHDTAINDDFVAQGWYERFDDMIIPSTVLLHAAATCQLQRFSRFDINALRNACSRVENGTKVTLKIV